MAEPDLNFVLARLDRIQQELREIRLRDQQREAEVRLRDEQREAALQTWLATLTRQMVEITIHVDQQIGTLDRRLDTIDETLQQILGRLPAPP